MLCIHNNIKANISDVISIISVKDLAFYRFDETCEICEFCLSALELSRQYEIRLLKNSVVVK